MGINEKKSYNDKMHWYTYRTYYVYNLFCKGPFSKIKLPWHANYVRVTDHSSRILLGGSVICILDLYFLFLTIRHLWANSRHSGDLINSDTHVMSFQLKNGRGMYCRCHQPLLISSLSGPKASNEVCDVMNSMNVIPWCLVCNMICLQNICIWWCQFRAQIG